MLLCTLRPGRTSGAVGEVEKPNCVFSGRLTLALLGAKSNETSPPTDVKNCL